MLSPLLLGQHIYVLLLLPAGALSADWRLANTSECLMGSEDELHTVQPTHLHSCSK